MMFSRSQEREPPPEASGAVRHPALGRAEARTGLRGLLASGSSLAFCDSLLL